METIDQQPLPFVRAFTNGTYRISTASPSVSIDWTPLPATHWRFVASKHTTRRVCTDLSHPFPSSILTIFFAFAFASPISILIKREHSHEPTSFLFFSLLLSPPLLYFRYRLDGVILCTKTSYHRAHPLLPWYPMIADRIVRLTDGILFS